MTNTKKDISEQIMRKIIIKLNYLSEEKESECGDPNITFDEMETPIYNIINKELKLLFKKDKEDLFGFCEEYSNYFYGRIKWVNENCKDFVVKREIEDLFKYFNKFIYQRIKNKYLNKSNEDLNV